jgi:ribA/ribD-fused uncharacterized protein
MHKWRKTKPSKVVGIDLNESNLESSRQGACVRYLNESRKSKLPPVLFIQADMTQALMQQENRYLKMLDKREPAPTPYLEQFVGLTQFDAISCQFAIHYACESEEMFRTFVGNLTAHGKGVFFGTCMDGSAVYSLLLGKQTHIFRADTQVFGEVTKEYEDGAGWTEDFGKPILMKLESFETAQKEYLVPFGKVTEILRENGYELVTTSTFSDEYANQTEFVFTGEHQAFSFLHRAFVFKRGEIPKKEEPPKEEVKTEIPDVPGDSAEVTIPTLDETKEKPKTKKLVKAKVVAEPGPEPVFFFPGKPELNEYKEFATTHEASMQIDGLTFASVEHYLQYSKAKQFGDEETAAKIMKTTSGKSVKGFGEKVKNVKEEEWNAKKDALMKIALKAKFTQHPELRKKLVDTGVRPIADADPRDKYWGIGTSFDTSKGKNPAAWPGKNVLGNMLQELRTELKE